MKNVSFKATLHQFEENGEKSGWTYFEIPAELAGQLRSENKKTFRVKGTIDAFKIIAVAILPMGDGSFILPVNAAMRKGIRKSAGAMVDVKLMVDEKGYELNKDLLQCLKDEPAANDYFFSLTPGHRNYFSKWVDAAKTETTKTKRLSQIITSLIKKMDYGEMIRFYKGKN